jgi:hypothetical protein
MFAFGSAVKQCEAIVKTDKRQLRDYTYTARVTAEYFFGMMMKASNMKANAWVRARFALRERNTLRSLKREIRARKQQLAQSQKNLELCIISMGAPCLRTFTGNSLTCVNGLAAMGQDVQEVTCNNLVNCSRVYCFEMNYSNDLDSYWVTVRMGSVHFGFRCDRYQWEQYVASLMKEHVLSRCSYFTFLPSCLLPILQSFIYLDVFEFLDALVIDLQPEPTVRQCAASRISARLSK